MVTEELVGTRIGVLERTTADWEDWFAGTRIRLLTMKKSLIVPAYQIWSSGMEAAF
jgi:hypothetical protein